MMLSKQSLKRSSFFARGFCGMRHVALVLCEKTGQIPALKVSDRFRLRFAKRRTLRDFVAGSKRQFYVFSLEDRSDSKGQRARYDAF